MLSFPVTQQQFSETKTNHSTPHIYILLRALIAFVLRLMQTLSAGDAAGDNI